MNRLDGRVCLVTGASSGIGRAIAELFAAEGAVVVCADVRSTPVEGGEPTVETIGRAGGRAYAVLIDLADPTAVGALVDDVVAAHGRLDVLVNNAATYVSKPLLDTTLDEWERVFAVNVTAVFLLLRAAVRHMLDREPDAHGVRGRIVNIASQHGFVGAPLDIAYGTSKSAVVYLSRQVATDYGHRGIVCNGVAPGKIMTGKGGREDDPEWVRRWQERSPYPRLGRPDDVAHAALFLASDEARYISGENLMVDGGLERLVRIGMVGAGWAAGQHAASLAALGEAPPVAVLDPDRGRAEELAGRCGAAVAEDLDALLRLRPDAAIVTTPTGAHAAAVVPLLAAGVAVFVEKPLSVTVEDARAVVAAAEASGVPVAVAYQWRAVPALETLADELAGQRIALLATVGVGITQARPWFVDGGLSSGLVSERGSHHLDLLAHIAGPVTQVRAVAGDVRLSGAEPVGDADIVTVTCTYSSGAVSTTALVWASPDHLGEQSLRVVADGGHYLLALDPHFRLTGRTGRRDVVAEGGDVPFIRQLARFLRAVRSGDRADVFCTPAQAAPTVAVVAAARLALSSGNAVTVGHP